jgi:hypothetical protein
LQPLIRFPSCFLISILFVCLVSFPISGNFPTVDFLLIGHKHWYCLCNYAPIPLLCFQFQVWIEDTLWYSV